MPLMDKSQLRSDANSDGISVLDACCVCGGGQHNHDCEGGVIGDLNDFIGDPPQ